MGTSVGSSVLQLGRRTAQLRTGCCADRNTRFAEGKSAHLCDLRHRGEEAQLELGDSSKARMLVERRGMTRFIVLERLNHVR